MNGGATPQTRRARSLASGDEPVPLSDYQPSLARLLSENRTFDSYLAGGAAILIEPNTTRFSRALDYFHDSEARVAEAFAADRSLLESAGYSIDVDLNQFGFVRAIVRKDEHATRVEWARDSAWRFMPTVRDDRVGFLLHPVDLAVDKVLALGGSVCRGASAGGDQMPLLQRTAT